MCLIKNILCVYQYLVYHIHDVFNEFIKKGLYHRIFKKRVNRNDKSLEQFFTCHSSMILSSTYTYLTRCYIHHNHNHKCHTSYTQTRTHIMTLFYKHSHFIKMLILYTSSQKKHSLVTIITHLIYNNNPSFRTEETCVLLLLLYYQAYYTTNNAYMKRVKKFQNIS